MLTSTKLNSHCIIVSIACHDRVPAHIEEVFEAIAPNDRVVWCGIPCQSFDVYCLPVWECDITFLDLLDDILLSPCFTLLHYYIVVGIVKNLE